MEDVGVQAVLATCLPPSRIVAVTSKLERLSVWFLIEAHRFDNSTHISIPFWILHGQMPLVSLKVRSNGCLLGLSTFSTKFYRGGE